jgi:hypothetical protein
MEADSRWRIADSRQAGRSLALVVLALALTGCGNIEPWVKPYERQALAYPILAFDPKPVSAAYLHPVY